MDLDLEASFCSDPISGEIHFVALASYGLILAASSWLEARSWLNLQRLPNLAKKEGLDSDVFPKICAFGKETDFSRIGHFPFPSENSPAYFPMQDCWDNKKCWTVISRLNSHAWEKMQEKSKTPQCHRNKRAQQVKKNGEFLQVQLVGCTCTHRVCRSGRASPETSFDGVKLVVDAAQDAGIKAQL